MVPLACELSSFEARLLAARLGAEGVVWELRGCDSVYPVGWVDVLVSADDLAHARELLLVDEIELVFDDDLGFADDAPDADDARPTSRFASIMVTTVGLLLCAWFLSLRFWL
jgi:hypothetical protein